MAIGAFLLSEQHIRFHDMIRVSESDEKFERFVENVKSGKRQLTPDQWLEFIRAQRKQIESQQELSIGIARAMRNDGWYLLIGVGCHALVVCYVRQKSKKP